jgi:hypothetical protein
MKRLIASLLVVIFGTTMVMAEVQAPASMQAAPILSSVADVQAQTADFADVEGITLNELEADGVKGEGGQFEVNGKVKVNVQAPFVKYEAELGFKYSNKNNNSNNSKQNKEIDHKRKGGSYIK